MCSYFAILLAVLSLGTPNVGPKAPGKVQALIANLRAKDDKVRLAAIVALGDLGPQAEAAVPALVEAMKAGPDEEIRLNAALALGAIGKPALVPLRGLLSDQDESLRYYSVWVLGLIGPDARETAPQVIQALKDSKVSVRRKAAYTLGRLGSPDCLLPLVQTLGDPDADVREAAGNTIVSFGARAVPSLARAVKEAPVLQVSALAVLDRLPPDASTMIPALLPLLRDPNQAVQKFSGELLVRQGKPAIGPVLELLRDNNPRVRQEALWVLSAIPADSTRTLPTLRTLAKDENPAIRQSALVLLSRLGTEGVPYLIEQLTDPQEHVRWTAAHGLGQLGAAGRLAIPALTESLKDASPQVRACVQAALHNIQQSAVEIKKKP